MSMDRPLTVGTAGHIDHGKTALVRALTGHDTDRLSEEKRRGVSIDLGFAPLDLPERRLSLVDVPGHERFVRTMIAGASGIDLFLMVVAADDGVMPQTREHWTVLRALGVEQGVVALTKCDLADGAARAGAREQVQALMPEVPLIEVSGTTGQGMPELGDALGSAAAATSGPSRVPADCEDVVLHVDRVFIVRGRGTVVTGTLWAGRVRRGARLIVLPQGLEARVREVQVHNRKQESAEPCQRVALNLAGIKHADIHRGDVVASVGSSLAPSYRLDAEITASVEELADRERVQVHHGTRQAPARVVLLGDGLVQLRLEAPLVARGGDRFVLRRIAPPTTLGGGQILDAHPRRQGSSSTPGRAGAQPPQAGLPAAGSEPVRDAPRRAEPNPHGARILALLRRDAAMPRGLEDLAEALTVDRAEVVAALEGLVLNREVVRIKPGMHYPTLELKALNERIVELIRIRGSITIAELRDALGISRKYSQALLEHLDTRRITLRRGDERVLRRSFAGSDDR